MHFQHNDEVLKENQDESLGQLNKFNQSKIKKFCAFFTLILIIGVCVMMITSASKESKTELIMEERAILPNQPSNTNIMETNQINKKRVIRSWRQGYDETDRGYIYFYIRESISYKSRHSFNPIRVPYIHYKKDYPFKQMKYWKKYLSKPSTYADERNQQTILYGKSGVFIIPSILNKNKRSYSVAQLISDRYATLRSNGVLLQKNFIIEKYIYPDEYIDRNMPKFNYRTGLFQHGVTTEFDSSFVSYDSDDEYNSNYGYDSSYKIKNPYYKKPPMKKSNTTKSHPTTTTTTSTSLATTSFTTVPGVPLLNGVQLNFDPASLPNNWSQCYNGTYDIVINSSLLSTILNVCNKGQLMLGCRPVGNALLSVAAMGLRNDVLYNCDTLEDCTNVANGVGWYFSYDFSWGFVNNTDSVVRDACDVETVNPDYRLCWHTRPSYGGGFRCGSDTYLNSDPTFERVIYHAN